MMGWDGMRISQMSFVSCKKSPEFIRFPWLGGLVNDFHGLVDDLFCGEDDELLFGESVSLKKPCWLLFEKVPWVGHDVEYPWGSVWFFRLPDGTLNNA